MSCSAKRNGRAPISWRRRYRPPYPPTLREIIRQIASLGGFRGRKCDGEPGVKTFWLGFARLRDFVRGIEFLRSIYTE